LAGIVLKLWGPVAGFFLGGVFVAVVLNGVPADALAAELRCNRNALYKTLFDARRKLRAALAANGYLSHDTSRHP